MLSELCDYRNKANKSTYAGGKLQVSAFCLVYFPLLGCAPGCIVLSTKLLWSDSWTSVFQDSVINRVLIGKPTGQHESASIYLQIGKISHSSMKSVPAFPTALLRITTCSYTKKQEGLKQVSSWFVSRPAWRRGSETQDAVYKALALQCNGKVPYLLTKEAEAEHISPHNYARIKIINCFVILASGALALNEV